ncbi:hypothetical protein [Pseudonocardia lacus]|uniref:hypothetical protein n=1 Tax=Pseudonocardia lacus TaxID=2835865 RepID=UPI001BDBC205|nr:hypothetical protein [Pseudonocardia lacus]
MGTSLTHNLQRLVLQGAFFVISVFLQHARGFSAIETGLVLLPATIGLLLSSAAAPRMARRRSQRRLIRFGFFVTGLGLGLLLAVGGPDPSVWGYVPGLFLMGVAVAGSPVAGAIPGGGRYFFALVSSASPGGLPAGQANPRRPSARRLEGLAGSLSA